MCLGGSPKMPAPAPERQAYKTPASKDSLMTGDDAERRRRMLMAIATSEGGVGGTANTTALGGSPMNSTG